MEDGTGVGIADGEDDGSTVGTDVGIFEMVGADVGFDVGEAEGNEVGVNDGCKEIVGAYVGLAVGTLVGRPVGFSVVGSIVGSAEGHGVDRLVVVGQYHRLDVVGQYELDGVGLYDEVKVVAEEGNEVVSPGDDGLIVMPVGASADGTDVGLAHTTARHCAISTTSSIGWKPF